MNSSYSKKSPAHSQPGSLSDAELLCRLLFPGKPQQHYIRRAESLLMSFGGLRGLKVASRLAADEREGLDDRVAEQICVAHELVHRQLKQALQRGVSLTSPALSSWLLLAPFTGLKNSGLGLLMEGFSLMNLSMSSSLVITGCSGSGRSFFSRAICFRRDSTIRFRHCSMHILP